MSEHPKIARPQVEMAKATSSRWIARCAHCEWEYANTAKTDVEYHARWHRGMHREGKAAVTR